MVHKMAIALAIKAYEKSIIVLFIIIYKIGKSDINFNINVLDRHFS